MKLTKRHWYATYLAAAFFGIVLGMSLVTPIAAGRGWVERIYVFETHHNVLIATVVLLALSAFAFEKKPVGPAGWPLYFSIGCCIGKILYNR